MKVFFRGLNSCVMRKADIARYKEAVKGAGHQVVDDPDKSDALVVWTCAFRQDFHDSSIRILKEYEDKYRNKGKRIVACGCLPSIDPVALKANFLGEVTEWKNEAEDMRRLFGANVNSVPRPVVERALSAPIDVFNARNPDIKTMHFDQFIKLFVSEGCPMHCTYCAEVMAFPSYKSFPIEDLVRKCRRAVEEGGQRRVALFADCVGNYGADTGSSLTELLDALVADIEGIEIAIKNLHPLHWHDHLDSIKGHIESGNIFLIQSPIQSANDRILGLMQRQHSQKLIRRLFGVMAGYPSVELETDVIAGFPSETESEFQETVDFVCEYHPKYVLLSGLMPVPGMPAAEFPDQVDFAETRRRVLSAFEQLSERGIICNYDMCDLAQKRFARPLIDQLDL